MATNKRKTTTAIVAGATALALLLGGTFAWTSISQQAKNETAGIVNVGGRLHDDFDGENKDVYVENFTDPLNGGQPIYARVRLDEYMEIGKDAGQAGNPDRNAVPVVSDTDINDVTTWKPHVPSDSCAVCATEGTCVIHEHWTWTMGGEGDNGGQTTFMPTFNKDKDSLAADINGTYHGTDNTDKVYYDDYVVYTTDNTTAGVGVDIAEADKEAYEGEIYSVTGGAYYDDDPDHDENDHDKNIGAFKTETETHTAKQTAEGSVMTMQEWIDAGSQPGNYWVYDTDGWAYWANPIMPGEATGLLLDSIVMEKNPGEKCYYAINVVGQFATVGDWEYFTDSTPSTEAMDLLETVSKNVATVTVTNVSGATLLTPGESYEFSANVTVNRVEQYAAENFDWSVLNADGTANTKSSISTEGVLTVADDETSENLIVVAKAKDSAYLGALGMSSVAVDVSLPEEIQLLAAAEVGTKVTIDNTEWWVIAKQDARALIWSVNPVVIDKAFDGDSNQWSGSDMQIWLNGEYLNTLPVLSRYATEKTIYTASHHDRSGNYIETNDKVFLLSEADVNGTANGSSTEKAEEYTMGNDTIHITDEIKTSGTSYYWCRSPYRDSAYVATISSGSILFDTYGATWPDVRPVVWVKYAADIELSVTVPDVEFNEYNNATLKDGDVITFQATATSDGEPMENPEFVYELYNDTFESPSLVPDAITSNGVWDTTGYGGSSPGYYYYVKVYVKGYPDVYAKLNFTVQNY